MIKIDNRELFHAAVLPIEDGKTAIIDVPTASGNMPISLRFSSEQKNGEISASWATVNNRVEFEFHGWTNSLGNATKEAISIGQIDGRPLSMHVVNHHVGNVNLVHFFLFKS